MYEEEVRIFFCFNSADCVRPPTICLDFFTGVKMRVRLDHARAINRSRRKRVAGRKRHTKPIRRPRHRRSANGTGDDTSDALIIFDYFPAERREQTRRKFFTRALAQPFLRFCIARGSYGRQNRFSPIPASIRSRLSSQFLLISRFRRTGTRIYRHDSFSQRIVSFATPMRKHCLCISRIRYSSNRSLIYYPNQIAYFDR